MALMAESAQINRVENGWVVTFYCAGTSVPFVAKDIVEVVGFLKGCEWKTPRPILYNDAPPGTVVLGAPTTGVLR